MIQPIVEGDGEVAAVPVLLRRLLPELGAYMEVGRPIQRPRSDFTQEQKFKLAFQIADSKPGVQAVLVLFDADDDCARNCVPHLAVWARQEIAHLPCAVVMARREYEVWLLAAIESLRGQRGILANASYEADPEAKRDAKGALRRLTRGETYSPTADQSALTATFDLAAAYRRCSSFRKLVKELCRILVVAGQDASVPEDWTT